MRAILLALLVSGLFSSTPAFAEKEEKATAKSKKDLRALFSFRREKFTENEARSQDFGVDVLLSTLVPVTPVVSSIETPGGAKAPLYYSTFFNIEGSAHLSFNYHWQAVLGFGYFSYDTRKENSQNNNAQLPLFHQFDMTLIPITLGARYRFGTTDIVPYVGAGVGYGFGKRKASFDYNRINYFEESFTAIVAHGVGGFEFYIAPRAGIRLEASIYAVMAPKGGYNANNDPANLPNFEFASSMISMRYASGLFFLF